MSTLLMSSGTLFSKSCTYTFSSFGSRENAQLSEEMKPKSFIEFISSR